MPLPVFTVIFSALMPTRYVWRSGRCLNSTATFYFGCKFDEPFRKKYPSDGEVFKILKTRRKI
uniref:DUF7808 domain-containing protein n=1 Tax=Setaria digitata TaxID=48799 RepID=A0A915PZW5_9BILA